MTKRRMVIGIGAPVVVVLAVGLWLGGRAKRAPSAEPTPANASTQTPRVYPPMAAEPPPAPHVEGSAAATPPAAPGILYRDSNDYAREIADKPAFKAFASSANLTADEQTQVSHILALYQMDDASLQNVTKDPDKLASMRRQLLIHMHIRVRSRIPSKWEAFEQANLLPSVADFANSPT
jgi:hypothetical protein